MGSTWKLGLRLHELYLRTRMQTELVHDGEASTSLARALHGRPPRSLGEGGGDVAPFSSKGLDRSSRLSSWLTGSLAASSRGATVPRCVSRCRTAMRAEVCNESSRASASATATER